MAGDVHQTPDGSAWQGGGPSTESKHAPVHLCSLLPACRAAARRPGDLRQSIQAIQAAAQQLRGALHGLVMLFLKNQVGGACWVGLVQIWVLYHWLKPREYHIKEIRAAWSCCS